MKYLLRTDTGIKVIDESVKEIKCGMKWYINQMLKQELTDYEARVKTTKAVLSLKSLVPIYIKNDILLFPTTSLRNHDMIFVNYHKVISFSKENEKTIIIFDDLSELRVKVRFSKIKNTYKKAIELDEYIKKKMVNKKESVYIMTYG